MTEIAIDSSIRGKFGKESMKRLIAIIAAAAVFSFFQFACPVPESLSREAMSAVGILLCCIILWVTEALPFIVTVVLIYVLLPMTGVCRLPPPHWKTGRSYSPCSTNRA